MHQFVVEITKAYIISYKIIEYTINRKTINVRYYWHLEFQRKG